MFRRTGAGDPLMEFRRTCAALIYVGGSFWRTGAEDPLAEFRRTCAALIYGGGSFWRTGAEISACFVFRNLSCIFILKFH